MILNRKIYKNCAIRWMWNSLRYTDFVTKLGLANKSMRQSTNCNQIIRFPQHKLSDDPLSWRSVLRSCWLLLLLLAKYAWPVCLMWYYEYLIIWSWWYERYEWMQRSSLKCNLWVAAAYYKVGFDKKCFIRNNLSTFYNLSSWIRFIYNMLTACLEVGVITNTE